LDRRQDAGSPIGIDDNFFEIGGHSLKAILLTSALQKEFDVKISMLEIFKIPTVRQLADFIKTTEKETFISVEPAEEKEYYPLSPAQKRLYIMQSMEPGNTAYNIPLTEVLDGRLDIRRFEEVLRQIIRRHESFRTSFQVIGESIVQVIHPMEQAQFTLEFSDFEQAGRNDLSSIQSFIHHFIKPFDLSKVPLVRAAVIKTGERRHIIIMDIHHIITDGFSMGIFIGDFMALYNGSNFDPLKLQYKDYSEWLGKDAQLKSLKHQEDFWLAEFPSEISPFELPADFVRPPRKSFEGESVGFYIGKEEMLRLKMLAVEEDATLFILLLTLLNVLLYSLSGKTDIVVGTSTMGRRHPDLEKIIGMFVNTAALRNFPEGSLTFRNFFRQVKNRTILAFDNQDYPFEELVEKVTTHRDPSRNPFFEIMFEMHNFNSPIQDHEGEKTGLTMYPFPSPYKSTKFDLSFVAEESPDSIIVTVLYDIHLFKPGTIEKLMDYYKKTAAFFLENPGKTLSQLDIISAEKQQRMYHFNDDLENE